MDAEHRRDLDAFHRLDIERNRRAAVDRLGMQPGAREGGVRRQVRGVLDDLDFEQTLQAGGHIHQRDERELREALPPRAQKHLDGKAVEEGMLGAADIGLAIVGASGRARRRLRFRGR